MLGQKTLKHFWLKSVPATISGFLRRGFTNHYTFNEL